MKPLHFLSIKKCLDFRGRIPDWTMIAEIVNEELLRLVNP